MTYRIVRYYRREISSLLNLYSEETHIGLSLEEAQEHCQDPSSRLEGLFFDGYESEE
jgi:hypothetical protein